jgi:hypothetical protein
MRSDKVFEAAIQIPNRYSLCQAAARATRRLHVPSTRTQDTMNDVLTDIGVGKYGGVIKEQEAPQPPSATDDIIAL